MCVQGCPSPGTAERGEGSGAGNGGCNRSDGLPPVPRTPLEMVLDFMPKLKRLKQSILNC